MPGRHLQVARQQGAHRFRADVVILARLIDIPGLIHHRVQRVLTRGRRRGPCKRHRVLPSGQQAGDRRGADNAAARGRVALVQRDTERSRCSPSLVEHGNRHHRLVALDRAPRIHRHQARPDHQVGHVLVENLHGQRGQIRISQKTPVGELHRAQEGGGRLKSRGLKRGDRVKGQHGQAGLVHRAGSDPRPAVRTEGVEKVGGGFLADRGKVDEHIFEERIRQGQHGKRGGDQVRLGQTIGAANQPVPALLHARVPGPLHAAPVGVRHPGDHPWPVRPAEQPRARRSVEGAQ